jgi:hypothetical protein
MKKALLREFGKDGLSQVVATLRSKRLEREAMGIYKTLYDYENLHKDG